MGPLSPSIRLAFLVALLGCSSSPGAGGRDGGPSDAHADTGADVASAADTGSDAASAADTGSDVASAADTGGDVESAADTGGDDGSVEGKPCTSQADCSSVTVCDFPIAGGCSAKGVCISDSFIGGCSCGGPPRYVCDCTGHALQLSCCDPGAPVPVSPSTSCLADAGNEAGSSPGSIACGTGACSTATNVCCVTGGGDGGSDAGFTSTCESAASCTTAMGVGLQCGSAADCPTGQVCCLWPWGASACGDFQSATSNCYGGGAQLCDPNESQNECVGNDGVGTCKPGTGGKLPMNYGTCQ